MGKPNKNQHNVIKFEFLLNPPSTDVNHENIKMKMDV